MHIVRVVYETGQQVEFGYGTAEAALATKQRIDGGDIKKRVLIQDDHGHDATLRIDGIVFVVVVDLARQIEASLEAEVLMSRIRQEVFGAPSPSNLNPFVQDPISPVSARPRLAFSE